MAKDWKSELKEIVIGQQKSIKSVIDDREKRESERIKKIEEIKKIIKPRFDYIKDIIEKDKYLISTVEHVESSKLKLSKVAVGGEGESQSQVEVQQQPTIPTISGVSPGDNVDFVEVSRRGERVSKPKINESTTELVLVMPSLSDVNRLDLMYQIEFQEEKPVLHAYHLLSAGKMENQGSAHDKFEDFVQDTLKRFLLSWFTRKEGTERDKERKFELIIHGHGLKD
jgi:hypothetical protein